MNSSESNALPHVRESFKKHFKMSITITFVAKMLSKLDYTYYKNNIVDAIKTSFERSFRKSMELKVVPIHCG